MSRELRACHAQKPPRIGRPPASKSFRRAGVGPERNSGSGIPVFEFASPGRTRPPRTAFVTGSSATSIQSSCTGAPYSAVDQLATSKWPARASTTVRGPGEGVGSGSAFGLAVEPGGRLLDIGMGPSPAFCHVWSACCPTVARTGPMPAPDPCRSIDRVVPQPTTAIKTTPTPKTTCPLRLTPHGTYGASERLRPGLPLTVAGSCRHPDATVLCRRAPTPRVVLPHRRAQDGHHVPAECALAQPRTAAR